jgi:DNA polymerase III subunit gamma/tau
VRENEIVLVSPYEFHRNKLNDDGTRRVVEDVISRYMGSPYRLICVDPTDSRSQARPTAVLTVEQPATPTNGGHIHPAEVPTPPPPEPDPVDDQRVRAAKSIFDATELDSEG